MKNTLLGCVASLWFSAVAVAAEVVFKPTVANEDGSFSWNNAQNWEGGNLPGINDVQVYAPSGEVTVQLDSLGTDQNGNTRYYQFAGMKFMTGKTVFKEGKYLYANAEETELHVAAGANVVCSNMIDVWNESYSIVKTGSGKFVYGKFGEGKPFRAIDVREGCLEGLRKGFAVKTKSVHIHAGAEYYANGYNYFRDVNPDVHIERGGVWRVNGGQGPVNIACLTGEGDIVDLSTDTGSFTDLQIKPTGDCVFSGTMSNRVCPKIMSGSTGRFILGTSDAIARCARVTGCEYLSFAPGVGSFDLGANYVGTSASPLKLADTNGSPVTILVGVSAENVGTFATEGPGNVELKAYATTLTNALVRHTGTLCMTEGTLTLGDASEQGDFDFSNLGAVEARAGATIDIKNTQPCTLASVRGVGTVKFRSPSTVVENFSSGGEAMSDLYGNLTVDGGDATRAFAAFTFKGPNLVFALNGGRIAMPRSAPKNDSVSGGPLLPSGFVFAGQQPGTKVVVNGGDIYLTGEPGDAPQALELNGGNVHFEGASYSPLKSANAENPCSVLFNGGTVYLSRRDSYYYNDFVPFADSSALELRVGEGGVKFVCEHTYNGTAYCEGDSGGNSENFNIISRPLLSAVDGGVDGGVKQSGIYTFHYKFPLQITGNYEAEGGATRIAASDDVSSGRYFGSGDTKLRNHRIDFEGRSESFVFCPHGSGRKLEVDGVGAFFLRRSSSAAPVSISVNELEIDKGVLFLVDPVALGSENASGVKLATAPARAANGRVLLPVVSAKNSTTFSFLGYDTQKGFTNISVASSTTFTNTDPSKLVRLGPVGGAWMPVAANSKVCAEALLVDGQTTVELKDNATIKLGDGMNPALLLLPSYGLQGSDTSSLDFGSSRGVVVCGAVGGDAGANCWSRLRLPVRGSNGLVVVGYPSIDVRGTVGLAMNAVNTYIGSTHINCAIVQAENEKCFSSGTVYVGAGQRYGGGVRFLKEGGVWANDFKVAGWGIRKSKWNEWDNFNGAMAFWKNGTVSGKVEFVDNARICAANGISGEISGEISGVGKVEIVCSKGVLRFSNSNTYSGGTDLIGGSTLELAHGESAGTGEIMLSGSTLRFVNTEPIVFSNKIVGSGTIELAGAPVTFTGEEFNALKVRTLAKGSAISFPYVDGEESVIRYGAVLNGTSVDFGDAAVTLYDVRGAGDINGSAITLSGEIHPGGEGAIGTLTFARAPAIAEGAKLVCEYDGVSGDKLEIAKGEFDLSAMTLDFKLLENARAVGWTTLVAVSEGKLNGEFSAVVHNLRRAESASVSYSDDKAKLTFRQGTIIWLR